MHNKLKNNDHNFSSNHNMSRIMLQTLIRSKFTKIGIAAREKIVVSSIAKKKVNKQNNLRNDSAPIKSGPCDSENVISLNIKPKEMNKKHSRVLKPLPYLHVRDTHRKHPKDISESKSDTTTSNNSPSDDLRSGDDLSKIIVWRELLRRGEITALKWCPYPNRSTMIAIGTENGSITVAEITNNGLRILNESPWDVNVTALNWSPCGRQLAIGGDDGSLAIFERESKTILFEMKLNDRINAITYSIDGTMLAIGGFGGVVTILATRRDLFDESSRVDINLIEHLPSPELVLALEWSPNKQFLAIGGSDEKVSIFDVSTWVMAGEIEMNGTVRCVKWSPCSSFLAAGGRNGYLAMIEFQTRSVVKKCVLTDENGNEIIDKVVDMSWSVDGSFLAAGGENICFIIQRDSFNVVKRVERNTRITCLDWQPKDGSYLAVGDGDWKVAVVSTCKIIQGLEEDAKVPLEVDSSCSTASTSLSDAISGEFGFEWSNNDFMETLYGATDENEQKELSLLNFDNIEDDNALIQDDKSRCLKSPGSINAAAEEFSSNWPIFDAIGSFNTDSESGDNNNENRYEISPVLSDITFESHEQELTETDNEHLQKVFAFPVNIIEDIKTEWSDHDQISDFESTENKEE